MEENQLYKDGNAFFFFFLHFILIFEILRQQECIWINDILITCTVRSSLAF